ncbi:type I-C CRISPR-associated protein Cas8c/Csd1 [Schinkia azotoformans]|uniref:type I-C CRISPR-associated protein Cas8c/Csd1 n=1 Tax=Schinkia azotoformans TaxID=1454 RepID=UPI002E1C8A8C|nr:type I-C CRISPR-associated protein Cas8c/Csd1 [Schinkia azotoformans]MED4352801.1 type I-C CRISPR-associated protein Cas8c/Csd1 [Schinkia azotoformans]
MSWLLNLYETYESNIDRVGVIEKKYNDQEFTLLPISHTTQNAHIEVEITEDGEFHSARVIDKNDAETLVPCTKDAGGKASSNAVPYPLHTKIPFAAGDFVAYGGKIKKEEPFSYYIKQLEDWAKSPYATAKVKSIYIYLSKKKLIKDLVEKTVLFLDADGNLIETWDKKHESLYGNKPLVFSVISGGLENAFIRFNVYSPNKILTKIWKDYEMYESYINYYRDFLDDEDLCYVSGKMLPSTDKHPSKIRYSGDKAKLISANDSSGFTFRGRFNKSNEVASISYEVSQKAHNALKWLINRQAKIIDQRVFLVWGNDDLKIPDPMEDTFSIDPTPINRKERISFTNQEFANEVAKALDGYKGNLSTKSNVNILILDSATTGRMAVLYYRNMDKEIYLNRLIKWHSTCKWLHRYRKDAHGEYVQFYGAPATKEIAFAAYGPKASDKVVKGLMERLLPCIIDDKIIPLDIIRSALQRASNPVAMEKWEWEKTLSITCALINKQEGYSVALDIENNDRDYLFGRLLAIADVLERRALGSDETRSSNAIRYMNSFSKHPARTWKTIQESLQPYQAKLGTKGLYLSRLIDEVASRINYDDFNNKPLSGKYLLGFYSQRHELYQKKEKSDSLEGSIN